MTEYSLTITLLSDATFGRGDGVAGLVDQEVAHDADGFPYIHGRTLKGLLREECDNLVAVLPDEAYGYWQSRVNTLFGRPGSTADTQGTLYVDHGVLPDRLRRAVAAQVQDSHSPLTGDDVLNALTTIRRQTAVDPHGAPAERSLRSARVVIRGLPFTARLTVTAPTDDNLTLLDVGALALRRVGSGRNRGRGRVQCALVDADGKDITGAYVHRFGKVEEKEEQ